MEDGRESLVQRVQNPIFESPQVVSYSSPIVPAGTNVLLGAFPDTGVSGYSPVVLENWLAKWQAVITDLFGAWKKLLVVALIFWRLWLNFESLGHNEYGTTFRQNCAS
jgi:hypothetical protein